MNFDPIGFVRIVMIVWTLISLILILRDVFKHKDELDWKRAPLQFFIGMLVDFFDTWGIGCYAPNMAIWKFTGNSVKDDLVPGTLNLAHTVPVALEGILFLTFVEVEPVTLLGAMATAVLGSVTGSRIVTKLNIDVIRYAMAVCLILVAIISVIKNAGLGPWAGSDGNTAIGLHGVKLIIFFIISYFCGALMNLGFGYYAPCMGTVLAMGLQGACCFPIMMGACNVLMNAIVPGYIKADRYDRLATLMILPGGVIGVLAAYFTIKYAFSLHTLTYIVCVVMIITAIKYILDANADRKAHAAA